MSSPAYRLRRADWNGASVECSLVSRAASALFLLRLANAIARPVIVGIRPVSRIVGRGGRAGRLCLLAVVGSSLSSDRSFLTSFLTHLINICSGVGIPLLSRLACFALCVPCITRPAGVVGHPRSSCVGMWGVPLLASPPSGFLLPPPPSRSSCRAAVRFASLRYSPRPATRRAGSCLRRSSSAGSSLVLVACRAWGVASCPHGGVSSWVVLVVVRAVWIMWRWRVLVVPMVYLYHQLIVHIVRLDF